MATATTIAATAIPFTKKRGTPSAWRTRRRSPEMVGEASESSGGITGNGQRKQLKELIY
jgi:hypothetical protein